MRDSLTLPQSQDHQRWIALVDQVSPKLLVEQFLDLIRHVDDYADPAVTWAEIRSSALVSFEALLASLKNGDSECTIDIAVHVGVTRARARIPMSSLMTAIRIDFQVLWNSILDVSEAADAQLLIQYTTWVWRTVDTYVRQTQDAYIAEEKRMADEAGSVRRKLLAELLRNEEISDHRLDVIADSLGVSNTTEFLVVAADNDEVANAGLRTELTRLERAGLTAFGQYRDTSLIVFIELPETLSGAQSLVIDGLRQLPVGLIERAEGLAGIRRAVPLVVQLANLAHERAITPADGWTKIIHSLVHDLNLGTFLDVHPRLADCGEAERNNLLAAVRAYLETGSVSDAAEATFCHRNTLTNRLQRFRELTNIDVTVPTQAALLVVLWA